MARASSLRRGPSRCGGPLAVFAAKCVCMAAGVLPVASGCSGDLVVGRRKVVCNYFETSDAGSPWPDPNWADQCRDAAAIADPTSDPTALWIHDFHGVAPQTLRVNNSRDGGSEALAWRYEADTTGNVVLCPAEVPSSQFGEATIVDLSSWGSPNGTSDRALRMAADLRLKDLPHRNGQYWGIKWEFETPGLRTLSDGETRATFDFSAYDGVGFWARLATAPHTDRKTELLVEFPTPETTEQASGGSGICERYGYCWAHLSHRTAIHSTCWEHIRIDFALLTPEFGGAIETLKMDRATSSHVFGIEFAFNNTVAFPIDVLITGIYLYRHSG